MTQFSSDPFATPVQPGTPGFTPSKNYPTPVVTWQLVYVALMLLLYVAVMIGAAVFVVFREEIGNDPDFEMSSAEVLFMGAIYGGISAVIAIMFLVGVFWRRGMGGWVYNLILIAIGMTSCCTWPLTIPLLIYWIRDKDVIVGG